MPRLSDIYEELARGDIEERPLIEHRPKRAPLRGYCGKDGRITVNPIPDTLDTLIHELLHRRHPTWSERTVKRETTKLIHSLTPEEMRDLYVTYCVFADRSGNMHRAKAVQ